MGNISSKLEANSIILQTAGKGLQPKVNVHFPWYLICFSQHNLCYLPNPTSKNKTGRKVTVLKKKKWTHDHKRKTNIPTFAKSSLHLMFSFSSMFQDIVALEL